MTELNNSKYMIKVSANKKWLEKQPWFDEVDFVFTEKDNEARFKYYNDNKKDSPVNLR